MILDAASLRNPQAASGLEEELSRLSFSPDYAIRDISRKILERLGHTPTSQSARPKSLPADYRISLPPTGFGTFLPPREPSSTASLPDPVGPLEVIGAVERELEIVAQQAELPEQNVMYRVARLTTQMATDGQLQQSYEDNLRNNLSSIGLRFTFNRPRVGLARRAMFRVIAELADAGELDTDALRRLDRVLRFYDPVMLLTEPAARSQEVPPMPSDDWTERRKDSWLEDTEEVIDLMRTHTEDGRIILAEETKLKNLDWGVPTEKRRSVVRSFKDRSGEEEEETLLLSLVNRLCDEYPTLLSNRDEQPLIARHSAFARYLSPGENWLALNPAVGRRLGWSVGKSGLFRWEDEAGRTAIESVWWQDGNPSHSPPELRSEVGEGWLVLATERALSQISDVYRSLKRSVFAEREHTKESGEKRVAVAERDTEVSLHG